MFGEKTDLSYQKVRNLFGYQDKNSKYTLQSNYKNTSLQLYSSITELSKRVFFKDVSFCI